MSKLRHALAGVAATSAMLTGVIVTGPAAHAGWACDTWNVCGTAQNNYDSDSYIRIGADWNGSYPTGAIASLWPGRTSHGVIKDVDAIYVPAGCHGHDTLGGGYFPGGQWTKIGDNVQAFVRVDC